jgi:ATP-dependent helicase/nuclease subunit B
VRPEPENVRRHFLGWDGPLPAKAAAWLARDWDGRGPLDLSACAVVLPTRQAGRRLREALAARAAAQGRAVFAPRILTSEMLVPPPADAAAPLSALLAWVEVLTDVPLADFRAVFPADPPRRDAAWALRLARQFTALQRTLAEGGLTMDRVADGLPPGFPDRSRWEQLGALAGRQAARLRRGGRAEPEGARVAAAPRPEPLAGIARLVVLAVPDPMPLALAALAAHAARLPVEVAVFAPATEADRFDAWGRPEPAAWVRRGAPWPDFAGQVHVQPDPAAAGDWIAALAGRYGAVEGRLACGVADPDVTPRALEALTAAGLAGFDPAGRPHRDSSLHELLAALAAFARDASWENTVRLGRHAAVLERFAAGSAGGPGAAAWLEALDRLRDRHLPEDLGRAREVAAGPVRTVLDRLHDLRLRLRRDPWVGAVADGLAQLGFGPSAGTAVAPEVADAWDEVLAECAECADRHQGHAPDTWWDAALQRFGDGRAEDDKPRGALELPGWLELLWEDAPHVVVAGANEGRLPESVAGDAFLPESLRRRLGLRTNDERFARDAYLLAALLAARQDAGRVDVLVVRASAAGDPLKPSRLLLAGPDADLPARIDVLFRELPPVGALPAWSRTWRLKPRRVPPPRRMRVTGFRRWLECPFRFYLGDGLGLAAVDGAKTELDAFDFGSLCHGPLEEFGTPEWRDCTDEGELAARLVDCLEREVARRFGGALALPLELQIESARQRLRRAAAVQAAERSRGWVVVAVERPFTLSVGGIEVAGRIDRIDRNESTGEWRVVDYKTTDAATEPAAAHLGRAPLNAAAPDWVRAGGGGPERYWTDLQLPLYLEALPGLGLAGPASAAYFLLPKAVGDTRLAVWEDYAPELHASARACAAGVAAAVAAGRFWPPNEDVDPERDDFAALFHRGVAASVDWEEPG